MKPTNGRIITIAEVYPKKWGVQAPHRTPQPRGPALGKGAPRIFGFEAREVNFGRARGLWAIETAVLKGAYKIAHAPRPRAEALIWNETGSDPPADLGELLDRQEATGLHPGDIHAGGSHYGEHILSQGHWCCHMPFWSPPSSLLALRDYSPTSGLAPVPGLSASHPRSQPHPLAHQLT